MRASFLDDLSAAEARRRTGTGATHRSRYAGRRAGVISHTMSCDYILEYPVDDTDEDEDDDIDEDDEGEDDEDDGEEEVETWQVSYLRPFR